MTEAQWRRNDMNILSQKNCTKCKKWKFMIEFGKDASRKDGLKDKCRQCSNEIQREWYKKNPDKVRKYNRKWRNENKDKNREYEHAYRAKAAGGDGRFTDKEWRDLCNKYNNRCLCCGEAKPLTADHVIAVTKGGTSNIDNIQPLCRSCNSKKHTKEIDYRHATHSQMLEMSSDHPQAEKALSEMQER
jgi:5-methylcytosine-specific restriction endonuclease McrA